VNSEGPLFTLLDRKLITIVGRKPAPGRPLLYGTTQDFLTHFGLNDLDDLPKMEELEAILKRKETSTFDLEPMEMERKPEETETPAQSLNETVEETEKNSPETSEAEAPIPMNVPSDSSSPLPTEDETQ
jgi:segregation and condensation protein B